MRVCFSLISVCLLAVCFLNARPNVILLLSDDQGYGDLACTGNTEIDTPHIDTLYRESVRFTDFHVNSVCAPSRAAIMTGLYSTRVGVWHTLGGRDLVRSDAVMLPQFFADNGYRTQIELGKSGDDEIRVCIDRDGQISVFGGGTHRLSMALVLRFDSVPVLIKRVHSEWVAACLRGAPFGF